LLYGQGGEGQGHMGRAPPPPSKNLADFDTILVLGKSQPFCLSQFVFLLLFMMEMSFSIMG